ncbi:MAG: hypothetical protein QXY45_04585 [Candidatus Aenigmatarchaeota archaeon]
MTNARNLIDRARGILYERLKEVVKPSKIIYIIPAIIVAALLLFVIFFILYRKRSKKKVLFPALEKIKGTIEVAKQEEQKELLKERR